MGFRMEKTDYDLFSSSIDKLYEVEAELIESMTDGIERIKAIYAEMSEKAGVFNDALDSVKMVAVAHCVVIEKTFEERSKNWRFSSAGTSTAEWIDSWEEFIGSLSDRVEIQPIFDTVPDEMDLSIPNERPENVK